MSSEPLIRKVFLVEKSHHDALVALARGIGTTPSHLVRGAIRDLLEDYGKLEPVTQGPGGNPPTPPG